MTRSRTLDARPRQDVAPGCDMGFALLNHRRRGGIITQESVIIEENHAQNVLHTRVGVIVARKLP